MSRLLVALATGAALGLAAPALAQSMGGMSMPGMKMPKPATKPATKKPAARKQQARKPAAKAQPRRPAKKPAGKPAHPKADAMQGMDMAPPAKGEKPSGAMPGMDMGAGKAGGTNAMPGMDMSGNGSSPGPMPGMKMPGAMAGMEMTGTALPAGDAPPPSPPGDHYADRFFPATDISRARANMMRESGGQSFGQIMFNLAEYQVRNGRDGYRWDGEGWFGGDINRLTIKTEGEGNFREGVDGAEVQALYSRAIGPYFNLQAGVRHDFQPTPNRTYATIGFEGLAPYMFEVSGAAFISPQGEVLGRLEGYYDQRLTQRLVLQPRVELNLSAQDMPAQRLGAGLTDAELGLRLRYEVTRQFAPYVGVSYQAKTGRTADYARADGMKPTSTSLVAGVRLWF
ncbi:MAG: copper resistance protein B [Sphingomonas sp.]|uniref:copper resistance protein B n=1 Tax=Sphingomonas sp. TaxID=28214 RepID=UPI001AC33FD6|nr:copper resistance protein B [Sphingomonas sp.]MBN8815956.1 copper resistance protein B [Sphingomonas sp.]